MSLSISIVTYNSDPALLSECLNSLTQAIDFAIKQGCLSHVELFLIDNASAQPPELTEMPSSIPVSCISNANNLGFGRAHNLAIAQTTATWHMILNPDAIIETNYLANGIDYLQQQQQVVMVAPCGVDAEGHNARLCKRYPGLFCLAVRALLPHLKPDTVKRYEYWDTPVGEVFETELASGCCMLARTTSLKTIGGFSPLFFLYFEDFDLAC